MNGEVEEGGGRQNDTKLKNYFFFQVFGHVLDTESRWVVGSGGGICVGDLR